MRPEYQTLEELLTWASKHQPRTPQQHRNALRKHISDIPSIHIAMVKGRAEDIKEIIQNKKGCTNLIKYLYLYI